MTASGFAALLLALSLAGSSDAQEIYRLATSPEEKQAISHIGQAEYYARMALRSLEASEKVGKAFFFNYRNARRDLQRVLAEFETYLRGDDPAEMPAGVPLIADGRYFAESIRDFLSARKPEDRQATGNVQLPPPAIAPESGKTKRDKIEEILKKGL